MIHGPAVRAPRKAVGGQQPAADDRGEGPIGHDAIKASIARLRNGFVTRADPEAAVGPDLAVVEPAVGAPAVGIAEQLHRSGFRVQEVNAVLERHCYIAAFAECQAADLEWHFEAIDMSIGAQADGCRG